MTETNRLTVDEVARLAATAEGEATAVTEDLKVFSEDGTFLGVAPRLLCHRLGLIHKAVFCFITDEQGQLLLQSRGSGRLDVAVGGHLSAADTSPDKAVAREMLEELGFSPKTSRMKSIGTYLRFSGSRTEKPRDFNREWRQLFVYQLEAAERENLSALFAQRLEQSRVRGIDWFKLEDVLTACDQGKAADGLAGSLTHYLLWLTKGSQATS